MKHEVTVELAGGKRLSFETGRMAKQASGAALVTQGESVVLGTAVASPIPKKASTSSPSLSTIASTPTQAAAFPADSSNVKAVRASVRPTSRQIDRPVRPLFPEGFRNETQVIVLVFSADRENDPT